MGNDRGAPAPWECVCSTAVIHNTLGLRRKKSPAFNSDSCGILWWEVKAELRSFRQRTPEGCVTVLQHSLRWTQNEQHFQLLHFPTAHLKIMAHYFLLTFLRLESIAAPTQSTQYNQKK